MEMKILEALTEIKDGKMTAIASTDTVDRVGDSLDVNSWDLKNFKKNPVLLGGHNYQPEYVIGVAEDIRIEGNKILFEPKFHDLTEYARSIKKMFEEKYLKAWSVGYLPKDKSNELLEVSAVAVPANPDALTLYKKAFDSAKKDDADIIEKWINDVMAKEIKEKTEVKEGKKANVSKKSPACRMDNESKEECVARKIPELIKDDGMEQDQAAAVANKLCSIKCSDKPEDKPEDKKGIKDGIDIDKLQNELIELKEGRILSGKNRSLITKTIEALKGVADILEKLLEETTQPEKTGVAEEQIEVKTSTPLKKALSDKDKIMVETLKKFNQITANALNRLKK